MYRCKAPIMASPAGAAPVLFLGQMSARENETFKLHSNRYREHSIAPAHPGRLRVEDVVLDMHLAPVGPKNLVARLGAVVYCQECGFSWRP